MSNLRSCRHFYLNYGKYLKKYGPKYALNIYWNFDCPPRAKCSGGNLIGPGGNLIGPGGTLIGIHYFQPETRKYLNSAEESKRFIF